MIQLVPQLNILLACKPVDFRRGVDGLAALCRNHFHQDPMSGTLYVFRNRKGTLLKMLCYDSVGYWLFSRRFSKGKIKFWPDHPDVELQSMRAQELSVLLYQGLPDSANLAQPFRTLLPQVSYAAIDSRQLSL